MPQNLILLGFMGAGKTTVGRILAERLGWSFVDIDTVVAHEAGQSIERIFQTEGEAGFRARERASLLRVCRQQHQVIAPGGGAVLDPDSVEAMRSSGLVIVLQADLTELWRRVKGSERPLATDRDRFQALYREREALYHMFPYRQLSDRTSPQATADAILQRFFGPERTVAVALGERSYDIMIAPGLLAKLGQRLAESMLPGPCMVVTHPLMQELFGHQLETSLRQAGWEPRFALVPPGESSKSLEMVGSLYDQLVEMRLERRQPLIALGGGVIGDLAGFVAATYRRGVPFVQVPTTLLAQIDSSVGGKVAVNHPQGKNLIGAFYQPCLVACDPLTLQTLPEREYRSGLAELIKYGMILDAELFMRLERDREPILRRELSALVPAIARACELKAQVVAVDEREGGWRAILNLGHTFGHAIETVTHYHTYLHGEAVGIGLLAAGLLAIELGVWGQAEQDRLQGWLHAVDLPTNMAGLRSSELLEAMRHDKKVESGHLLFVVPEEIGNVTVRPDVPLDLVERVLRAMGAS